RAVSPEIGIPDSRQQLAQRSEELVSNVDGRTGENVHGVWFFLFPLCFTFMK
ncbi:hypothetical protein CSUI_007964, partial [Cystoisospora suis]